MGYLHSIPPRAPAAFGALQLLRNRVAAAFFAVFAPQFITAMLRSSVAATERPPTGPPGEVCSHKLPQPCVHRDLVDAASLLARRVSCICQSMWKPAAPVLTELVWDGRSRVSAEKKGHQGHAPQHISDGAHMEDGRGL